MILQKKVEKVEEVEMVDYMFPFEKLELWKLAKALAIKIYKNAKIFQMKRKLG